jgi:RNA polymerase sigma-70 factor (ECF subfamily)
MMDFAATLRAAKCGEEWAIAALWRALNPSLLRYLRGRARDVAEDLASETWLRAARDLHGFRGEEDDFRAWIFTICRHALVDWQRRAMRTVPTVSDPGTSERPAADDTEAEAIDDIATEEALALVSQLPSDQADVVLLRVVAGLDTERVARILGKRAGTVRVIQHRALRRLAELVVPEAASSRGVTK